MQIKVIVILLCLFIQGLIAAPNFLSKFCIDCHSGDEPKGNVNFEALGEDFTDAITIDTWQEILEQVETNQMPPKKKSEIDIIDKEKFISWIRENFSNHNISPLIDYKRRTPEFGNKVDHESLFSGSFKSFASSPPRLWRLNPHIYNEFIKNLDGLRHATTIHQPFLLDDDKGLIKDYSSEQVANESTLELLLMNCNSIAQYQTEGILKREWDGKMRLHKKVPDPFHEIIESEITPSADQLSHAITYEYELFLGRKPTNSELKKTIGFGTNAINIAGNVQGLQTMLVSIMLKPEVVYRVEVGLNDSDSHGRRRLSDHELAYAIAYALTDSPPDKIVIEGSNLLALANSGKLDSVEQIREVVKKILNSRNMSVADYRMFAEDNNVLNTRTLRFFREFFGYHHATRIFKDENRISIDSGFDTKRIVTDADQFVMNIFDKDHDVLRQLLTSNHYFVSYLGSDEYFSHDLKYIKENTNDAGFKTNIEYINRIEKAGKTPIPLEGPSSRTYVGFYNLNHKTWDYPRKQPFALPKSQRSGILTHPAWLIAWSGNFDNDPIRRGKWIREHLLADHIKEIPITVNAVISDKRKHTLRDRLKPTRSKECWSCHKKMNPLGLPFENYDDFGRFRKSEILDEILTIFPDRHRDARSVPIVTSGEIIDSGDKSIDGPVDTPFELLQKLANSSLVRQSFVRHNFRFWLGRNETIEDSLTLIDADNAYLRNGGSMKEMIASLLSSDSFLYRK